MNRDSARLLLVWTALWVVTAVAGAALLHYGRHLTWSELGIPVVVFLAIQIALYGGILLARKRHNLCVGTRIFGLCIWADITLCGYYAVHWQLIAGYSESDLRYFSELMLIFVIVFALIPQRWMRRIAEVKCARCGHHHEGRDCTCGRRADSSNIRPSSRRAKAALSFRTA